MNFTHTFFHESTGGLTNSYYLSLFVLVFIYFLIRFDLLLLATISTFHPFHITVSPSTSSTSPPGSLQKFALQIRRMVLAGVTYGLLSYIINACKVSSPVRLGFSSSIVVSVVQFSFYLSPRRACFKIAQWSQRGFSI